MEEIVTDAGHVPTCAYPGGKHVSTSNSYLSGWPPTHFGSIPTLKVEEPSLTQFGSNVISIKNSDLISSWSHSLVKAKDACFILLCWSAQRATISDTHYLILPPMKNDKGDVPILWVDDSRFFFTFRTICLSETHMKTLPIWFLKSPPTICWKLEYIWISQELQAPVNHFSLATSSGGYFIQVMVKRFQTQLYKPISKGAKWMFVSPWIILLGRWCLKSCCFFSLPRSRQ